MSWTLMFFSLYLAELPDKTSLATLALLRRHRALFVWIGAGLALILQTVIALTAGRLLSLVPKGPLSWLEILLFFGFAGWLWKESNENDDDTVNQPVVQAARRRGTIFSTFLFVFVAEFLDLTQIATMAFAARHPHNLWLIGLIAACALLLANATVIVFGRMILARIPGRWMERVAAILFGVIGVVLGLGQLGVGL